MNQDASTSPLLLNFRVLVEASPGAAWKTVFRDGWPGWRAWSRGRRSEPGPTLEGCRRALEEHMPEFLPVWRELVACVGAEAARFLSFWCPPPFLGHCSQAVRPGPEPLLVRNYDLDPRLSEATLLHTRWNGRTVAGMVDGLCGLADGMNEDGLVVSLAYGGSRRVGRGFGVPLVVRYLLETCGDVDEAVATLERLPHHMAYNLALVDRSGRCATVFLRPEGAIAVSDQRFSTNHQLEVVDEEHARFCNTRGRAQRLRELTSDASLSNEALLEAFGQSPLRTERYREGFGTVYTAAYRPESGTVSLHWPSADSLEHRLGEPLAQERQVGFRAAPAAHGGESREWAPQDWLALLPIELRSLLRHYWPELGRAS